MTVVTRLSPADLDAALAVVSETAAAGEERPFELAVLECLRRLVPADRAAYFEYGGADGGRLSLELPVLPLDWGHPEVRSVLPSYPLNDRVHRGRPGALRLSDVLTRAKQLRNAWCVEIMRPCRVEHELKVWLPSPAGVVRGFFFTRDAGARNFSDRDVDVLTVLRPHLALARERWERQRLPLPPSLTGREAEILLLVREGLTNREIAERLVLARSTVRTHLEHIFEKLDVHTRTAAVTHAFGSRGHV